MRNEQLTGSHRRAGEAPAATSLGGVTARAWSIVSTCRVSATGLAVTSQIRSAAICSAEIRRDLRKFYSGTPPRKTLLKWASRLSAFDRPVLVIWTTEDRMMPLTHARRLEELFPNARQVHIDDSWTLIPQDLPEKFAAALREFVPPA